MADEKDKPLIKKLIIKENSIVDILTLLNWECKFYFSITNC